MVIEKRSAVLFWAGRVQLQLHAHKSPLCSDRRMDRPASNTWRCVCSAFVWLTRKQRPQGWERFFHPSHLRAPEALWESSQNSLSWVDLTDKKTGTSCWCEQQHWLFPAQKFICPILHLRNKETEKGWFTWPGVRPRTHLSWWRACTICSPDSKFSLQGNTPKESILIASARTYSLSVPETADFLISDLKYSIKYNLEWMNFSIKYSLCITRKCEDHVLFCIHRPLAA